MYNSENEQLEQRIQELEKELDKQCPVEGWSFGAMMLGIWWGIGNRSYLTLIRLVPGLSLVWMIISGYYGHKWAWDSARKKGIYQTKEQFIAVQKSWDKAGKIIFYVFFAFFALFMFLFFIMIVLSELAVLLA